MSFLSFHNFVNMILLLVSSFGFLVLLFWIFISVWNSWSIWIVIFSIPFDFFITGIQPANNMHNNCKPLRSWAIEMVQHLCIVDNVILKLKSIKVSDSNSSSSSSGEHCRFIELFIRFNDILNQRGNVWLEKSLHSKWIRIEFSTENIIFINNGLNIHGWIIHKSSIYRFVSNKGANAGEPKALHSKTNNWYWW